MFNFYSYAISPSIGYANKTPEDDCSVLNQDPEKQLSRESALPDNLRTYFYGTMIIQT